MLAFLLVVWGFVFIFNFALVIQTLNQHFKEKLENKEYDYSLLVSPIAAFSILSAVLTLIGSTLYILVRCMHLLGGL